MQKLAATTKEELAADSEARYRAHVAEMRRRSSSKEHTEVAAAATKAADVKNGPVASDPVDEEMSKEAARQAHREAEAKKLAQRQIKSEKPDLMSVVRVLRDSREGGTMAEPGKECDMLRDLQDAATGNTFAHVCVMYPYEPGSRELMGLYLHGVEGVEHVVAQDILGRAPLHIACESGAEEMVVTLLDAFADPNQESLGGYTPLHLAARSGSCECVWQLLSQTYQTVWTDIEAGEGRQTAPELTRDAGIIRMIRQYRERRASGHRALKYLYGQDPTLLPNLFEGWSLARASRRQQSRRGSKDTGQMS